MTTNELDRRKLKSVAGWLTVTDMNILSWILEWQNLNEAPGDLVELGVFEGKSAIMIGAFQKPGEHFTVCDLFDNAAAEESISSGVRAYYADLSQKTFEDNYLSFHAELPKIIRGLSSTIVDHVAASSCRLIHIDASHQYEHVKEDTASAKRLLRQSGVVIFDDFRTEHTPGTSAAAWEAVINDDLRPICVSQQKMYATWGNAQPLQDWLIQQAERTKDFKTTLINMPHGRQVVRLYWKKPN